MDTTPGATTTVTRLVPVDNLPALDGALARADRKIRTLNARHGTTLRPITLRLGPVTRQQRQRTNPDGSETRYTLFLQEVTLEGDTPRIAGRTLVAVLEHVQDSDGGAPLTLVMRVPGSPETIDLAPYQHAAPDCHHCNMRRQRNTTYLLAKADQYMDGSHSILQVGSTCLKDFTGHDGADAIAAYASILAGVVGGIGDPDDMDRMGAGHVDATPLEVYLAWVAASIRLDGWTPKSKADVYRPATAVLATQYMDYDPRTDSTKDREAHEAHRPTEADISMASHAIEWAHGLDLEDDTQPVGTFRAPLNDYLHNINVIARMGYVTDRTTGLAASIVSSYQRHTDRVRTQAQMASIGATSRYVGKPKDRMKGMKLTVLSVRTSAGDWGVSHIHTFTDGTNLFKWFCSGEPMEAGKVYDVDGTVKKHATWQGVQETHLGRCAFKEYDPNAPVPEPKAKRTRKAKVTGATTPEAGVWTGPEDGLRTFDPVA